MPGLRRSPRKTAVTPRRLLTLILALVVFLVPAASLGANGDHRSNRSATFLGIDGLVYDLAPPVVLGMGDMKFYGPDFDLACGYGGALATGMRNLSKLARIIERSGRRVVFTVVPNKSTVLSGRVDPAQLPHALCDQVGLSAQRKLLDQYRDPAYLALPRLLERDDNQQIFWNTDLHWTPLGASVFTRALAAKLDPRLGKRQTYRPGRSLTALGGLNALLHIADQETVPTAIVKDGIKVTPREVAAGHYFDHTWRSRPAKWTWPGRTVVVGDSMMSVAMATLRPIFAHGRFMWLQHVKTRDIVRAIKASDTVVFDTIQLFVPVVELGTEEFRAQVKQALRGS